MLLSEDLLNTTAFLMDYANEPIGVLKIQKLLYYSNAWSITLTDTPIFSDILELSKHGVIIPVFHAAYAQSPSMALHPDDIGDTHAVPEEHQLILESVYDTYGIKSDSYLRRLIQSENLWKDFYTAEQPVPITETMMRTSFQRMVAAVDPALL